MKFSLNYSIFDVRLTFDLHLHYGHSSVTDTLLLGTFHVFMGEGGGSWWNLAIDHSSTNCIAPLCHTFFSVMSGYP